MNLTRAIARKSGCTLYPGSATSVRTKDNLGQTFYSQKYQPNTTNGSIHLRVGPLYGL
jgi:hypothetical protein